MLVKLRMESGTPMKPNFGPAWVFGTVDECFVGGHSLKWAEDLVEERGRPLVLVPPYTRACLEDSRKNPLRLEQIVLAAHTVVTTLGAFYVRQNHRKLDPQYVFDAESRRYYEIPPPKTLTYAGVTLPAMEVEDLLILLRQDALQQRAKAKAEADREEILKSVGEIETAEAAAA